LQAAWEVTAAWQAGGSSATDLSPQGAASTAVIAALSFWDYSAMLPVGTESDAHKTSGRCFSVAAGRISYVHGFKGDPFVI
jgi:acyl transferase domain-containing protein